MARSCLPPAAVFTAALLLVSCPGATDGDLSFDAPFGDVPEATPGFGRSDIGLPLVEATAEAWAAGPARQGAVSFRDEFDALDRGSWYAIEEKTGADAMGRLAVSGGALVISTTDVDRNPFVYGKAFAMPSGGTVRVTRRARVSYANDYFAGGFFIQQADNAVPKQGVAEPALVGVLHINFSYDPGRYPLTKGFVAVTDGFKAPGTFAPIENAPFGQWIEETLVYEPATGKAAYILNGVEYPIAAAPATKPYFRVSMNAYGWYTGHRTEVDWISVDTLAPAAAAPGFGAGTELVSRRLEPSEDAIVVDARDVKVTLPPLALDSAQDFRITALGAGSGALAAWDVDCGSVTSFDSFLEIELPYPDMSSLPGEEPADKLIAVTWDPASGAWRQELAEFRGDRAVVRMDHLTTVALAPRGDAPSSELVALVAKTADVGGLSKADVLNDAWQSLVEGAGWAGTAGDWTSMVAELPALEKLNGELESIGEAAVYVDILQKVMAGDTEELKKTAIDMALSWAGGKVTDALATTGYQIASIGTFAIDYSLNTFATTLLDAEFRAYEWAYQEFYREYERTLPEWYDLVTRILQRARNPQDARAMLYAEFGAHAEKLWLYQSSDYDKWTDFDSMVAEAKGSRVGVTLSLTPEVKEKISANYKAVLAQRLTAVIARAAENVRTKLVKYQYGYQRDAERYARNEATIRVSVTGMGEGQRVRAALYRGDRKLIQSLAILSDGELLIAAPLDFFLKQGAPDRIVYWVGTEKSGKRSSEYFSEEFRIQSLVSELSFMLENPPEEFDPSKKAADDTKGTPDATPGGSDASAGTSAAGKEIAADTQSAGKDTVTSGGSDVLRWELRGEDLLITLTETTTVDSGTDNNYWLSPDFYDGDLRYEGATFTGYTRVKKEAAGQNAYGYERWTIVEEVRFKVKRPKDASVYLYLWIQSPSGTGVHKTTVRVDP
ncbi:MAG: hypothetical protein KBB32_04940 [Spirochaetia bacterium]|nr:hypothetical protein [Spirochaetia bacterium]